MNRASKRRDWVALKSFEPTKIAKQIAKTLLIYKKIIYDSL